MLKPEQVAERLNFSVSAVYRGLSEGKLPGEKMLGRWRTDPDELEEWRRSQRLKPSADPMLPARPMSARARLQARIAEAEARKVA